jgi:UDP-glucose 4-epimerase
MKVLVTGGTGFIGKHLCKSILKDKKCKLVLVDNLSNSNLQSFYKFISAEYNGPTDYNDDRLTFHQVDIQSEDSIDRVFEREGDVNVCIHLAAKVDVTDSSKDSDTTFATNVKGTQNILSSAHRAGVQTFVFTSSAAVYGNAKRLPISEEDPTEPISNYGRSKLLGERLIREYSSRFKIAQSLRLFNVYGIGQSLAYAGVITRFAHRISNKLPPIIYGDGNQTRDFISVNDVTTSIIVAGGLCRDKSSITLISNKDGPKDSESSNVFNVGTGVPTTISQLARLMIELIAPRELHLLEPIYEDRPEEEIRYSQADPRRSGLILGFDYRDSLRSGLKRMFSSEISTI